MPSRARANLRLVGGAGVGDQLPVDGIGDPSFEAAHGFHPGLGLGELAMLLLASSGGEPGSVAVCEVVVVDDATFDTADVDGAGSDGAAETWLSVMFLACLVCLRSWMAATELGWQRYL